MRSRRTTTNKTPAYVGIDNGVTGSIGVLSSAGICLRFMRAPTFSEQNYTKANKRITRIDHEQIYDLLIAVSLYNHPVTVVVERPMINPGRWKATVSAIRALEATLIAIERAKVRRIYMDSRDWQSTLLPKGTKGGAALKKASLDIGIRLFPDLEKDIRKHKDADGLLIAEYARRNAL